MTSTPPGTPGPAAQAQPAAQVPPAAQPEHVGPPGGAPPRSGTVAWAVGFLAYLPIPMVGLIVAGVTQLIVGLAQRTHGGLAATNGVRAANWGLTQLCLPVLVILALVIGILTGESTGTGVRFTPVMNGVMVTVAVLFFVVALLEAIYAIVGTVQASRGREVRLPVIPFLRATRG